jgi:hypothetical protein
MRVLSTEEFLKKVRTAMKTVDITRPSMVILPNWQLKLSIPVNDGDLRTIGQWLGPNPNEMGNDQYTIFLSEVDVIANRNFAPYYLQDETL